MEGEAISVEGEQRGIFTEETIELSLEELTWIYQMDKLERKNSK